MGMGREDFLMQQIDEIRTKAQNLQEQLEIKENELIDLEQAVDEKEAKVQELSAIITYKRDETNQIVSDAAAQLNETGEQLESKIDTLMADVEETLARGVRLSEEQISRTTASLEEQNAASAKALEEQSVRMSETINGLVEQTTTALGTQQEILSISLDAQTAQIDAALASMEVLKAEVADQVAGLTTELEAVKAALGDKVHSENVKCFRNVQSSLDDLKDFITAQRIAEDDMKKLRKPTTVAIIGAVFGVVDFALLVVLLLSQFGVI